MEGDAHERRDAEHLADVLGGVAASMKGDAREPRHPVQRSGVVREHVASMKSDAQERRDGAGFPIRNLIYKPQ